MPSAKDFTIYQCDKCLQTFDTIELAEKCEKSHFDITHFSIISCAKEDYTNVNKDDYQPYWPSRFYIESKLHGMTGIYKFEKFAIAYKQKGE